MGRWKSDAVRTNMYDDSPDAVYVAAAQLHVGISLSGASGRRRRAAQSGREVAGAGDVAPSSGQLWRGHFPLHQHANQAPYPQKCMPYPQNFHTSPS